MTLLLLHRAYSILQPCSPSPPHTRTTITHAGIYPFAGREVARAFALISTNVADCNDDLTGLGAMELDALSDWEAKFNSKYPIVGRLTQK